MPWIGMTSVSPASVSMWPRMTLRKSTIPLAFRRLRDLKAVFLGHPALQHLVAGVAHADDEVRPDALADLARTSKVKRSRLSSEPP